MPRSSKGDSSEEKPRKFISLVYEKILEAAPGLGGADKSDLESRGILLPLILLYGMMWFGALIYFAVTGALAVSNRIFINLDGTSSDTICTTVPAVTTGAFQADSWGNWETSPKFGYNSSIYVLEFQGSKIDEQGYSALMARYTARLKALGAKAAVRNTAWSLIAWSTFKFSDPTTNSNFYSTASADVLFNANIWGASIASAKGFCSNNGQTSSFSSRLDANFRNGKISISYQLEKDPKTQGVKDYGPNGPQQWSGICDDQGGIQYVWGWESESNPDLVFTQSFDIKTTATIVALNTGLAPLSSLIETHSKIDDANPLPKGKFYLDPASVPMDPVYCLDDSLLYTKGENPPPACFYPIGSTPILVYPIVNQIGTCDGPKCSPCRCPNDAAVEACNEPQVIFAFIYPISGDSSDSTTGSVKLGIDLQKQIALKGDTAIEDVAFNALNDATNLALNNIYGSVSNQHCPGGSRGTGNGTCKGFCAENGETECLSDSDCSGKPMQVYLEDGSGLGPDPSGATMSDGAVCTRYCLNGYGKFTSTLFGECTENSQCPGTVGITCDAFVNQKNYQTSRASNSTCPLCSSSTPPPDNCCDDSLCCNGDIYTFDNDTVSFEKSIATSFKSLCPDDSCAAISVLIDSYASVFESMNDYGVMLTMLTGAKYESDVMEWNQITMKDEKTGRKVMMPQVMCLDSFYNASAMASLSSVPPTDLVQAYYRCHATLVSSLASAVGSAAGSANLYANTAIAILCFIIFKFYNTAKKDKAIISFEKKAKLVQELQGRKEELLEELVSLLALDYVERRRRANSNNGEDNEEDAIMQDLEELEKLNSQKNALENRIKEDGEKNLLSRRLRETMSLIGVGKESGGTRAGDKSDSNKGKSQRRPAGRSSSRKGCEDLEMYGFHSASESERDGFYSDSSSEGEDEDAAGGRSRGPARWLEKTVSLKFEGSDVVAKVVRYNPTTLRYSVLVLAPPAVKGKRLLAPEANMKLMSMAEPDGDKDGVFERESGDWVTNIDCVGVGGLLSLNSDRRLVPFESTKTPVV